MNRREFHAMGSSMLAIVDNSSPATIHTLQQVPVWFEQWEQSLSRFRPESELSRLNRSTGVPTAVSQILWDVFQTARAMEKFTNGLFTPTILDALIQAGYDRSFEYISETRILPEISNLGLPKFSTTVGWYESTHTILLPESVHLDFGGIAKGWAAHTAAERLGKHGPALVDAGGDIAISRPQMGGEPWTVGIRNPLQPKDYFETLRLERGGIATSGRDYHQWRQDDVWKHHIIDPRTNLPAETDILTATVIAPDAIQAEAAAKAVVISGSQCGLDWLEATPTLAGVIVLQSGETVYSQRMHMYLWRER